MKSSTNGYTLIEILIALTIVGALAALAIPTYQNYVIRAKVVEGLSLATSAKLAVTENIINGQPFINGWTAPEATDIVSIDPNSSNETQITNIDSGISIDPLTGIITITYTNVIAVGSPTLKLIPIVNGKIPIPLTTSDAGSIHWECHADSIPAEDTIKSIFGTLPNTYAPKYCVN